MFHNPCTINKVKLTQHGIYLFTKNEIPLQSILKYIVTHTADKSTCRYTRKFRVKTIYGLHCVKRPVKGWTKNDLLKK